MTINRIKFGILPVTLMLMGVVFLAAAGGVKADGKNTFAPLADNRYRNAAPPSPDVARDRRVKGQGARDTISKEAAIRKAQSRFGGKILSADTVMKGGTKTYRIKLISDRGRVRSVFVNGLSGEIYNP